MTSLVYISNSGLPAGNKRKERETLFRDQYNKRIRHPKNTGESLSDCPIVPGVVN